MKKYYYPAILITIGLIISVATPLAAKAAWPDGIECYTDNDCIGAYTCVKNPPTNATGICTYSQSLFNQFKANNPSLGTDSSQPRTVDTSAKINFTPQIPIPNTAISGTIAVDGSLIAKYTGALYTYALDIVGVLAVIMLMIAGLIWLTSRGDSGQIGKAKKMLSGALIGLFLILGANILLRTINPDLINLKPISGITNIQGTTINLVCCEYTASDGSAVAIETNTDDCKANKGKAVANASVVNGKCEAIGCEIKKYQELNGTIEVSSCRDTTRDGMQTAINGERITYMFSPSPCNTLSYCFQKSGGDLGQDACANLKDGTTLTKSNCKNCKIFDVISGNAGTFYCYGGETYLNDGTKGEPCGNDGGSTCHTACNNRDVVGGRSCTSGLWCCDAGQIKTD